MENIKKIFIVCGEPSGDLLAGNLIKAIKNLAPGINVQGVGGKNLSRYCDHLFYDIKELSVMGILDVFKKLPRFFGLKKLILKKMELERPDAIILVDFSGFNLRLAKSINKKIPVIYYVSPQIWASRRGRIKTIRKFVSKMVVLFKFEEEFYKKFGIQAVCAGHPLAELARPGYEKKDFIERFGLTASKKKIALLPGSRKQEIKLILPLMLKSAQLIGKIIDAQFIIAKSANLDIEIYQKECKNYNLDLKIIDGLAYDCLNVCDASMVCSGTATLEAAIAGKPFVVLYKTNLINYIFYRPQIKIPHIGMVNIVAGRQIVPEFIQFGANPKKVSEAVIGFLQDLQKASSVKADLEKLRLSLGPAGASERAAKIILGFLNSL